MAQIFGNFSDELPVNQEYLTLAFSPSSVPVKQRWKTNGLSADFMADYFATFFPGNEGETSEINTQAQVKNVVSFIANELLENAMKFNDETSPHPISIRLHMDSERLVFLSTNSIHPQSVGKFQAFIEELTASDPSELYIRHLEQNAADESHGSQLGLLTMMNDYLAKLGWKFETVQNNPELITVTTMVELTV
ncbi:MAG TPA: DUF6272 family protein [Coleofasciculaceae cyanobacterium]|jgi:hypothetical protein